MDFKSAGEIRFFITRTIIINALEKCRRIKDENETDEDKSCGVRVGLGEPVDFRTGDLGGQSGPVRAAGTDDEDVGRGGASDSNS